MNTATQIYDFAKPQQIIFDMDDLVADTFVMTEMVEYELDEYTPIAHKKSSNHNRLFNNLSFGLLLLSSTNHVLATDNSLFSPNKDATVCEWCETFQTDQIKKSDDFKEDITAQIQEFGQLKNNWDGYGSVMVSSKCLANCLSFTQHLIKESLFFAVYPNPNGTISFEWEDDNDNTASIEIGETFMSYYIEKEGIPTFHSDKSISPMEFNKFNERLSSLF